ncbi:hypothetical protein GJAV_G00265400 [Gymnothorax javanicus]|nr:hypothetical protein GJAV_G00265400 [Gymnothorax javanicus]
MGTEQEPPNPGPPLSDNGGQTAAPTTVIPPPPLYSYSHPQPFAYPGGPVPGMYPLSHLYPGAQAGAGPVPGMAGLSPEYPSPQGGVTQVVLSPLLADVPGRAYCPHCQQQVTSKIHYTPGTYSWLFCASLCIFVPFAFIPIFTPACNDVKHTCPNCKNVLQIYKRIATRTNTSC